MTGPRALRNGAGTVWGMGVRGAMMGGTRRALSSMGAGSGMQQELTRSIKCEGCGRIRGMSFRPSSLPRLQREGLGTAQHHEPASRRPYSSPTAKPWHTSPAKPPTAHPTTAAPLPEQLRSIMRLLPHSVVVCTATQPGPDGGPRAMTMSSFTSLTLSPTPLITFNVATPSRTLDAVRASGAFAVHVLAGDAAGASVAAHFTRGNVGGHVLDGLEDIEVEGGDGPPVLRGEGVLFALRCRVLADAAEGGLVRVRDHVIVVGEVKAMVPVAGEKGFGLVYADRRYRRVGEVLERE
ncbi:flavin reductase like domain-containing protein [Dactylonectria estremocensis]|uniref:Flavin reductase like domain-containing protein n=1 Tax=Dactylonectria estremocensis TaxID=1079267 RepID=A0A9P9IZ81_9HYPO|nr:flavin reductase like domain-containing protein [Dactylonectria estremocensis]